MRETSQQQRGHRSLFGRFEHHDTPRGDRGAELEAGGQQRAVPRHDRADDTDRDPGRERVHGIVERDRRALRLVRERREPVVPLHLRGQRGTQISHGRPGVPGLDLDQFRKSRPEQIREPAQQRGPLVARSAPPARKSRAGGIDGPVHVRRTAGGDHCPRPSGGRIDALGVLAVSGRDPLAADVEPVVDANLGLWHACIHTQPSRGASTILPKTSFGSRKAPIRISSLESGPPARYEPGRCHDHSGQTRTGRAPFAGNYSPT